MNINSVLVVCVGNICRSPLGEHMLAAACPDLYVASAGIAALVGHGADADVCEIASAEGFDMQGHSARQFTHDLAKDYDLILAMEKGHLRVIADLAPALSGKSMLFGQWMTAQNIPDPYRRSREFHLATFNKIREATDGWANKLGKHVASN